jgi:hypothetical protein
MGTLMGLLARVSADMDSEGTSLYEALSTARGHAGIGALIGVYPVMALQI